MKIQILEDSSITYTVRISDKSKRLGLKIRKNSWLEIIIPKYCLQSSVLNFVESKIDWIKKHAKKEEETLKFEISNNCEIFIAGKHLKVQIKKTLVGNSYAIENWEILILAISISKKDEKNEIKKTFEDYLKQISKKHLEDRSNFFAQKLGVSFKNITIKSQKTRWWSCSSQWNINYNYNIILCPTNIIDYLVVHELCHLREMWHDKKFWNLVESVSPNYRLERKWLKEHGEMIVV